MRQILSNISHVKARELLDLSRDKVPEGLRYISSAAVAIIFLLFYPGRTLFGQYSIQFIVTDSTKKNEIYIAGNFNQWDAGNPDYKLKNLDSMHKSITIRNRAGYGYKFKFTRGNWGSAETTKDGRDIEDREVLVDRDTVVFIEIKGWNDDPVDLSKVPDSLRQEVARDRSFYYRNINIDSSYWYAMIDFEMAQKNGDYKNEIISSGILAEILQNQGKADLALDLLFKAKRTAELSKDTAWFSFVYLRMGSLYDFQTEYDKAIRFYHEALRFSPYAQNQNYLKSSAMYKLGRVYFETGNLDSSGYYGKASLIPEMYYSEGPLLLLGDLDNKRGDRKQALIHYRMAIEAALEHHNLDILAEVYRRIGQDFNDHGMSDSSFYYAKKAYMLAVQVGRPEGIAAATHLLVEFYKKHHLLDSAFIYQEILMQARDSLFSVEKSKHLHQVAFQEERRLQDMEVARKQFRNNVRIYALLSLVLGFLIIVFFLWRNNMQKKEAYLLIKKEKQETEKQKAYAESTLEELKSTQQQLIQSEKMASLGELTSGIAHEIKNPLNFINNFSEINLELIGELEEEKETGPEMHQPNAMTQVIKYLKRNSEKISHHGKRIDEIIKGMLFHSRVGNSSKEWININSLCEESLKLAYHGFRAREKTFHASYDFRLEPGLPAVMAIPQEISRALLNIIHNAFYAVNEKRINSGHFAIQGNGERMGPVGPDGYPILESEYVPHVGLSTNSHGNDISIKVTDNGVGIPEMNIGKIFQPFFTTKPTGEGTGLGLSIVYDIITKSHKGQLKVNSRIGIGTEFEIILPRGDK